MGNDTPNVILAGLDTYLKESLGLGFGFIKICAKSDLTHKLAFYKISRGRT